MKISKNKIRKRKKINSFKKLLLIDDFMVVVGLLLVVFFLIGIFAFIRQVRPTVETSRSEMSKLPVDIKKDLLSRLRSGSVSAELRVPILMYHYVEYVKDTKDTIRESLNIMPSTFELQVITLKNAGYHFLTAMELGEIIDRKKVLPKKPILLTFDDGHWDFDTVVLPILKKYNIKATAYIISGFTGGSDFMTDNQIKEVVDSGLVDVGAHTVHHISLKDKLFPVVKYEVGESKKMLEAQYHIKVVSFAYPNGAFDQQAIDIVRKAGFTTAVSTVPGVVQSKQNRFFLYRLRPGYRAGNELLEYIQGNSFRVY